MEGTKKEVKRVVVTSAAETYRCAQAALEPDGDCIMERGDPPYKLCHECPLWLAEPMDLGDTLILYDDGSVELQKEGAE